MFFFLHELLKKKNMSKIELRAVPNPVVGTKIFFVKYRWRILFASILVSIIIILAAVFIPKLKQTTATATATTKPPTTATATATSTRKGYCISIDNNPNSWHLLKPDNTPGWKPGQNCWATDGTISRYESGKSCYGGNNPSVCNSFIGPDGNVTF
jgi:hypothetical protein